MYADTQTDFFSYFSFHHLGSLPYTHARKNALNAKYIARSQKTDCFSFTVNFVFRKWRMMNRSKRKERTNERERKNVRNRHGNKHKRHFANILLC